MSDRDGRNDRALAVVIVVLVVLFVLVSLFAVAVSLQLI